MGFMGFIGFIGFMGFIGFRVASRTLALTPKPYTTWQGGKVTAEPGISGFGFTVSGGLGTVKPKF